MGSMSVGKQKIQQEEALQAAEAQRIAWKNELSQKLRRPEKSKEESHEKQQRNRSQEMKYEVGRELTCSWGATSELVLFRSRFFFWRERFAFPRH